MCQKGVNTDQLKMMIAMANDQIATVQRSLEQIHHMADHAELTHPSASIAQASVMLGEARGKLEHAAEHLDGHSHDHDASVELV